MEYKTLKNNYLARPSLDAGIVIPPITKGAKNQFFVECMRIQCKIDVNELVS